MPNRSPTERVRAEASLADDPGCLAAAAGLRLDRRRRRVDGVATGAAGRARRWSHAILNLSSHRQERLLYVGRVFRGGLEERYADVVRVLLGGREVDDLLGHHVALIAH